MAFPTDKLDIKKISKDTPIGGKTLLEEYNLIITTKNTVYDTSKYNLFKYIGDNGMVITSALQNNQPMLFLGYNTQRNKADYNASPEGYMALLIDSEITDIKIKSKREFLGNQLPMQKIS